MRRGETTGETRLQRARTVLASLAALVLAGCGSCESLREANNESVVWIPQGHGLATLDIDGDGGLDIIGLCATARWLDPESGPCSICAFDGDDMSLRWRVGEYDRELTFGIHLAAIAGKVFVVDPQGRAQALSPQDGSEIAFTQLSERAREVCALPDGAWVVTADNKTSSFLFDPPTIDPAKRPPHCFHDIEDLRPRLDDMMPMAHATNGTRGAIVGLHIRGTPYPMAAGFVIPEGMITWKRALSDGDPLLDSADVPRDVAVSADHVFAGHGHDLVALDPATGETQWRQPMKSIWALHADERRVYVGRWQRLDVLDVDTGKSLGGIGRR